MKFTVRWDEENYVWPPGTDPELDGNKIGGERMKVMGRVLEDGGAYLLIGTSEPDASFFDGELFVPRGRTLEIVLVPVLDGVEGIATPPKLLPFPFPKPPTPAGVELFLR